MTMRWLENITGGYSSSAKVVSGTLVLSLPDAKSPVVWRMELKDIKAAAFEIKTADNGVFVLVMRTQNDKEQDIAPFDNKTKALKALMAASRAMEQAHGTAQTAANDKNGEKLAVTAAPQGKQSNNLMLGLFGILALAALLFGLTKIGPQMPTSFPADSASSSASTGGNSASWGNNGAGKPGVPVSADDFLRQR